ncbi:MAG: DUF3473 domain-containing protein [Parvularculaceae bacterium]
MAEESSNRASRAPAFAMSVDVEDYFQVWAFSDVVPRADWDRFELRVEETTRRVLDLFDRRSAKATFFLLGWIAERAPGLVREIAARGHEIAAHGYDHVKAFNQSRSEFSADVKKTKRILEDISGEAVRGYRAAGFSIDARAPFAYEALCDAGYAYSSSSHPIAHDHYGDPHAPRAAHRINGVIEAPVATAELLGVRMSAAGGGWFRASPYALSRLLISRASKSMDGPVIFYFHPWEIDPDQPRIANASARSRIRHYLNLAQMEGKIERLLGDFQWGRVDRALGIVGAAEVQV